MLLITFFSLPIRYPNIIFLFEVTIMQINKAERVIKVGEEWRHRIGNDKARKN